MRRLTMMAGALGVALMMSTGAFAQVPPDPANPNEAIPDAQPNTPYGEPINLETAKKVAAAAIAEAAKRNWNGLCVAVVGPSGDWSISRSRTIASMRPSRSRSTRRARRRAIGARRWCSNGCSARGAFFAYLPTLDDVIASRGGNPIVVGGKLIGAIGVSGGTGSQDDVVSQAGAAALK